MIADLRERISVERRTRSGDGGGGAAVTWTPIADLWARIEIRPRGEDVESEGRRATAAYRVTIRRRTDVNASMRAVWRGKMLYFRGVADEGPGSPTMTILADDGDPL